MKIRMGFVTNSSSTNFTIQNKTNGKKDLVDFVKENPQLIEMYVKRYGKLHEGEELTQKELIQSAKKNNINFGPGSSHVCSFGDEDGTLIGAIFDYILRDGGSSKSFTWKFHSYNR